MDEALYRRINLAIEFVVPDFELRQQIWIQHIPPAVKLDTDVDIKQIAMNYEITGGFIKNVCTVLIQTKRYRLYYLH